MLWILTALASAALCPWLFVLAALRRKPPAPGVGARDLRTWAGGASGAATAQASPYLADGPHPCPRPLYRGLLNPPVRTCGKQPGDDLL